MAAKWQRFYGALTNLHRCTGSPGSWSHHPAKARRTPRFTPRRSESVVPKCLQILLESLLTHPFIFARLLSCSRSAALDARGCHDNGAPAEPSRPRRRIGRRADKVRRRILADVTDTASTPADSTTASKPGQKTSRRATKWSEANAQGRQGPGQGDTISGGILFGPLVGGPVCSPGPQSYHGHGIRVKALLCGSRRSTRRRHEHRSRRRGQDYLGCE